MHPAELKVHRLNTKAFIDADPVSLILHRNTYSQTASGGYVWNRGEGGHGTPLPDPQIFRLIPASQSGTQDEVRSSNGRTLRPSLRILGVHDADIARWDQFLYKGIWYEIVTPPEPLHTDTSVYQQKGLVVVYEDN